MFIDWLAQKFTLSHTGRGLSWVQWFAQLNKRGIKSVFGDLGNTATLLEAGLEKARMVVSTIPDTGVTKSFNSAIMRRKHAGQ